MAAKVYSAPNDIQPPVFNVLTEQSPDEYFGQEKTYLEKLREYLELRKPKGKMVGEIIRFQVADGYASYMVASLRPLELIHINLWDGYEFRFIERLNAEDVKQMVEQEKKMAAFFGNKR